MERLDDRNDRCRERGITGALRNHVPRASSNTRISATLTQTRRRNCENVRGDDEEDSRLRRESGRPRRSPRRGSILLIPDFKVAIKLDFECSPHCRSSSFGKVDPLNQQLSGDLSSLTPLRAARIYFAKGSISFFLSRVRPDFANFFVVTESVTQT